MKNRNLLVAATLAIGMMVAVAAGAMGVRGHGCFDPESLAHGVDGPPAMAMAMGMAGPGFGHRGKLRGLMRALDPSAEQRDQIFEILHAQAPAAREKMKELRAGLEAIQEQLIAGSFNEAKVREIAEAQAERLSDLIVMHAQTLHRIYNLLTPEQQEKLAELKAERQ